MSGLSRRQRPLHSHGNEFRFKVARVDIFDDVKHNRPEQCDVRTRTAIYAETKSLFGFPWPFCGAIVLRVEAGLNVVESHRQEQLQLLGQAADVGVGQDAALEDVEQAMQTGCLGGEEAAFEILD